MSLYKTGVEQGELEGIDMGSYALYMGIPYARPPVGELRFGRPRKAESWSGVRMAKNAPPIAWQNRPEAGSFYEKEFYSGDQSLLSMDEDCLYLNIWTPAKQREDRLPVMLWIHGGAFNHGYGHEREFDGRAYCERGVILVTIQYRLGVFGFLSHPWLEEGGNLALQDQAAAISWVYDNIGRFGGDKGRITIAGQSAGGVCVQAQLCNRAMDGKIHGAIMQSGGGYGQLASRMESRAAALERGEAFLRQCGISSREALMGLEAGKLLAYANEYLYACRIVCDGKSIPGNGEAALSAAGRTRCPACWAQTKTISALPEKCWKTISHRTYLWGTGALRSITAAGTGVFCTSSKETFRGTVRVPSIRRSCGTCSEPLAEAGGLSKRRMGRCQRKCWTAGAALSSWEDPAKICPTGRRMKQRESSSAAFPGMEPFMEGPEIKPGSVSRKNRPGSLRRRRLRGPGFFYGALPDAQGMSERGWR